MNKGCRLLSWVPFCPEHEVRLVCLCDHDPRVPLVLLQVEHDYVPKPPESSQTVTLQTDVSFLLLFL